MGVRLVPIVCATFATGGLLAAYGQPSGAQLVDPKPPPGIDARLQDEPAAGDRMALEVVWSIAASWSAVAVDQTSGDIYAIKYNGEVWRLDRDGKQLSVFILESTRLNEGSKLRLANLVEDATPELVVETVLQVRAFDVRGKLLWEYAPGDSVNDVWTADLDGKEGDGRDEVIVGYNGFGGLHVLNHDGNPRWKSATVVNVWHVRVAPTAAEDAPEILTPGRGRSVGIFDRTGAKPRRLELDHEPKLVLFARIEPQRTPIVITSDGRQNLAATDLGGNPLWQATIPAGPRPHVRDGLVATDQPWFVVSLYDGRTLVYATQTGERLASMKVRGMPACLAWVPASGDKPPLLVTATGGALVARVLKERPISEQGEKVEPTK